MLVLTLKCEEKANFYLEKDGALRPIGYVQIQEVREGRARVGFELPKSLKIVRDEIDPLTNK